MTSAKLTLVFAMALIFGQLQCAAWCTVSTCGLTELNDANSRNLPPCHSHHSDSGKHSPAAPCSHRVVIARTVDVSAVQAPVAAPLVAILPSQLDATPGLLISGEKSVVVTTSPPGSGGPSSVVLRI